ncbi:MAG: putative DNA binding domain-containing protein [Bacilli bacterium]|nr:putative DNA binding domain-containing protein [Bacilli bacterium]
MEKEQIRDLIEDIHQRKYETRTTELKSGREGNPKKFYDTLSSFSNTSGGVIVFGINEKEGYAICGVKDVAELQKVVQEVSKEMEPVVRPVITPFHYAEGIDLLIVEVEEMPFLEKPCYYKPLGMMQGSFIRTGDGDEPMTEFEIFQFQMFKKQSKTELETFEDVTFERSIDSIKLDAYLAKAIENKPNFANLPKPLVLEMLGLAKNGLPTLTCLLLFGRYPQEIAPMMSVNCVKVDGDEYVSESGIHQRFLANVSITGTIAQMYAGAFRFLVSNMNTSTYIDENGNRNDRNQYPLSAIRELLLNALIHRDYSYLVRNIPISVVIYRNRIEITNPGSILGNYKVEDLGKEYLPIRNAFLCKNAEDLLETENRHSGIMAVFQSMKKEGLFPPLFESNRGFFKVTLFHRSAKDYKNEAFVERVLDYCYSPRSKSSLASFFGFAEDKATYFYSNYIKPLVQDGLLFLTIPESPGSKYQRITSNKEEVKK